MKKKFALGLSLAVLVSLASCDKEPLRPDPKPDPNQVEKPEEPKKPEEPAKPEPKVFEEADFKAEMLSPEGVLTLPEHFTGITTGSLDAHKAQIKAIVAPGVEEIAAEAFKEWTMLTSVNFAKATKIGNKAFEGCNGITSVDLPEATEAGEEAFAYCAGITKFNAPKLAKAGNKAFIQCHNLTVVSLPELTELGEEAFSMCLYLSEVNLPKLTKLGNKAFFEAYSLRKVTLGETKPEMSEEAEQAPFLNTSVAKALYVPASAEASYTEWANKTRFISLNNDMGKLTANFNTELPRGVKIREKDGIKTLHTSEDPEFSLENFVLNPAVNVISGSAFSGFEKPDAVLSGYFRAYGVDRIGSGAFSSQDDLVAVEFPNATSVENSAFANSGKLETILMPKLKTVKKTIFEQTGIEMIHLPNAANIEEHAFAGCQSLKYLILGDTPPQIPELKDINSPLNASIFGLDTGGRAVKPNQVTIVVPDAALPKYAGWAPKYTQIKEVIPVSKFKR